MTQSEHGNLTDAKFWDSNWAAKKTPMARIDKRDRMYGCNGIFPRMVRRYIGDIRGLRVLELGGGGANYRLLTMVKWFGVEATAVDYSPVGLGQLSQLFEINGCKVTTVCGDFFDTKLEAHSFDIVCHWGVMEHFPDPQPLLELSRTMLKPTGCLLCSVPNMLALGAVLWRLWAPENWAKHVLHESDEIERRAISAGFASVKEFYFGYPAIQLSTWEKSTLFKRTITQVQRAVNALEFLVPIYDKGARRLSSARGFFIRV